MDFQLSEDQNLLKQTMRKISLKEFAPKAAEIDEREEFPWHNRQILEEQGVFGINCPEEYGGAGAGLLSLAIAIEEVARVCASTAHIIAANIRSVDFLARYGNDEFVIILPELGKLDGKRIASKICQAEEEKSLKIGGHKIRITVSGGIATIRAGEGLEELYDRVDTALYLAKEKGGNRCEVG